MSGGRSDKVGLSYGHNPWFEVSELKMVHGPLTDYTLGSYALIKFGGQS